MGLLLSLLVAVIASVNNVFVKKGANRFSILVVTWAWQAFSLIVLVPVLFFQGVPALNTVFYLSASAKIVLFLLSLIFYATALRLTDLSKAVPMLAITPIVTMIMSFFLSG